MVKDGVVKGCIDLIDETAHVFDDNGRHSVEIIPEEFDVKMTSSYIHITLMGEDL
jgi:hypothetical protein